MSETRDPVEPSPTYRNPDIDRKPDTGKLNSEWWKQVQGGCRGVCLVFLRPGP